jgi:hypothetical protein
MRIIRASIRAVIAILPRDNKSNVPAEYCVVFALIGLFAGVWGLALCCHHRVFSAGAVSAGANVAANNSASDRAFSEKHYRIRDLSESWALSRETVRVIVKDHPGVAKIRNGRKKAHTVYSIPESAARSIHSHYWGVESGFDERHFRIAELAGLWAVGRESVRLMIKDEPGVLRISLGRKKAHTTYSVPASVAQRIHNLLLYAV